MNSGRFPVYLAAKRSPEVVQTDLEDYLRYLAVERGVSAACQRLAFCALLFGRPTFVD